MRTVTLRLTIEVTYETNGVATKELESMLWDSAKRLAEEGLFTGDTPAEVTSWTPHVDAIFASAPDKVD